METPPADWNQPPRITAIELTLRCNARCLHCGSSAGAGRRDELTLDELKVLFSDLAWLGGEEVCLLGGEPLLCGHWQEAVSSVADAGMRSVIITNGALVDRATAKTIAGLPGIARVAVSLDGASPEIHDKIRGRPGSFREAHGALERLHEEGVECGAITTVMQPNLRELPAIAELLSGRGLAWQVQVAGAAGDRFSPDLFLSPAAFYDVGEFLDQARRSYGIDALPFAGAHDIGYFSKRLSDYGEMPQEQWRGCDAGLTVVGVTSDGGVKGCLSLPPGCVEASLRDRSMADIWRDGSLFARNRRFVPSDLSGFCSQCEHGPTCRAGCQEMCWSTTGCAFENRFCFHRIENEGGFAAREGE